MGKHLSVKKEIIAPSLSHDNTTCHLATPPLKEVGVARQWELLNRPLPPIKGDTQSNEAERKFHFDINHIKKKVYYNNIIPYTSKHSREKTFVVFADFNIPLKVFLLHNYKIQ